MKYYDHQRRQFLQHTALGIMTAALPGFVLAENGQIKSRPSNIFKPDVEVEFISRVSEIPIMPGANTSVFKYYGKLLKGPQTTLTVMPGYLGIIHWHGMHVPQKMDGHPMYEINQGGRYVYEFEVKNPAGTNWYHSHTHEMTATQVYSGLAGLITVTDEQEQRLDLPGGEFDIPIIIQDRRFTAGNQL
jgi:suppressor of ftsI/bilirubin oxidase